MSDEIYINTGATIQQPYQAQAPSNNQQPVTAQQVRQITKISQQPGTYSTRSPFTYRNPSTGQQPSIASNQSPFTYVRQGQTPFTYNFRTPFTYARQGQTPFTYTNRTPSTYARQGQTPIIYSFQSPFTYRHPSIAQQPNIRNAQQPVAYRHPSAVQQPSIYQNQSPFTYARQGQTPFTYARQGQTPVIYAYQSPFTYARQGQSPFTYQHQTQVPYIHTVASSVPFNAQGRQPYIYAAWTYHAHGSTGTPINHASEVNISTNDAVQVYVWCTYNGNNIEVYASRSNQGTGFVKKDSGLSYTLSDNENVKIGTLVDAGTGYKVRYVAGSFYGITNDESGEPAVIPVVQSSQMPNSTSTTGGTAILANRVLWTAGAPNFVKLKVISQPFLQDDTGSASASVNITLHFDKSGAQAYNYPITLYGELEIEEDDGGEGEGE